MVVGGFSSSAVERRQNRAPGSPEVRVGGPLKLREKEERGGAERDSIPPPPSPPPQKEPGRIALRQCALPASRRMGIFFSHSSTSPFSLLLLLLSNKPVGLSMCCEH